MPLSSIPADSDRVPWTRRRWTVTVALVVAPSVTPWGGTRATVRTTSVRAPATLTARVGIAVRGASAAASPWTVTSGGSAAADTTSYPDAGVPATTGEIGSVRVVELLDTETWTCALGGEMSTCDTGSPRPSIATRSTSWFTSRPAGWIRTRATAETTWSTCERGPVTVTSAGVATGSDADRPVGRAPRSTTTGTVASSSGSMRIWTRCGE